MDSLTSNYEVIITLLISGILGALGQGIRVWFGLSELIYNKNFLIDKAPENGFRKSGSIFIGYITGLTVMLLKLLPQDLTIQSMLIIVASGYVVTDLIESISTHIQKR